MSFYYIELSNHILSIPYILWCLNEKYEHILAFSLIVKCRYARVELIECPYLKKDANPSLYDPLALPPLYLSPKKCQFVEDYRISLSAFFLSPAQPWFLSIRWASFLCFPIREKMSSTGADTDIYARIRPTLTAFFSSEIAKSQRAYDISPTASSPPGNGKEVPLLRSSVPIEEDIPLVGRADSTTLIPTRVKEEGKAERNKGNQACGLRTGIKCQCFPFIV